MPAANKVDFHPYCAPLTIPGHPFQSGGDLTVCQEGAYCRSGAFISSRSREARKKKGNKKKCSSYDTQTVSLSLTDLNTHTDTQTHKYAHTNTLTHRSKHVTS